MNILVGFDGSNVAKEAVNLAIKHAKAFDAKIYVITSEVGGHDVSRTDIMKAESELGTIEEIIRKEDVTFETKLLIRGMDPGEDLIQFAKEKEIDEIVIGIKRRSKVGKFLFGSTAQYVILKASCPVVTVK